jgi:hypothetical protein
LRIKITASKNIIIVLIASSKIYLDFLSKTIINLFLNLNELKKIANCYFEIKVQILKFMKKENLVTIHGKINNSFYIFFVKN